MPEPVTAEVVARRPAMSPLRFGLRTLMAITAVCSVQFALMSYLGVFAGLILGGLICLAGFTLVLFAGLALFDPVHAAHLRRLDRLVLWLMLALVALGVGTILAGGGALILAVIEEVRTETWLRSRVGLSVKETWVVSANEARQALEIAAVFPGSAADEAGLRSGDYIVNFDSTSDFQRIVSRNRGKSVDLEISTDLSGLPGTIKKPRIVPLAVP
jgi:hypothetical protein